MALLHTPPAEMGSQMPEFQLRGVDGQLHHAQDYSSAPVLVVMFICNHCPYVKAVEDRLISLARELKEHHVQFVGICSNDEDEYPEDSFENMVKRAKEKNYSFAYLQDKSQEVARAFGAVCTPDFFVYDKTRRLQYRGRLDDNWKDAKSVKNHDLKNAIMSLLQEGRCNGEQHSSMGCSIKWIRQ